jgi:hypothetical protein
MARPTPIDNELARLRAENEQLKANIVNLQRENEELKKRAVEMENLKKETDRLRAENEQLKANIVNLQRENEELKKGLGVEVQPIEFIKSLQRDLIDVHQYAISQNTETTYVVSDLNIQLKTIVTQKDGKPLFRLPSTKADLTLQDKSISEAMSTININLKPIPLLTQSKPKASLPVESIEGIGIKIGNILRSRNINTVRDLALADVKDLISIGISEKMAREFIGMAKLMLESEFVGIEGIDEQAAELLVRAGKVDSKEKLASSDPQELFNVINKGIKEGLVKVPKDYTLTLDDVKRWIESAKRKTR